MRQESDNSTPFTPPSLSDLLARFVAEQSDRLQAGGLPFEPGSEVQLHEAGAAQAADPRLAREEAIATKRLRFVRRNLQRNALKLVCFRQACVTGEFARAYSHHHVHIMTGRLSCTR